MRFIYTKIFTKVFTAFVIIALLVILDALGYLAFLKNWFLEGYGFATTKVSAVTRSVKGGFTTIFTIKNLASDNALLNQQVDELSFENARLKAAREENLTLRRALNFKQESQFNLLAVEVLTLDPTGFSQKIVIDKGADANVQLNQAVVISPGLLVGKISRVYNSSSEVTLITDPSSLVNAQIVYSVSKKFFFL